MKRALVFGITGMDGAHLAEQLLDDGYEVHGVRRRTSSFNTWRIDHILKDRHEAYPMLRLHYGDITDGSSIHRILTDVKPHEIYNLAAQSHVGVSFETPEYSTEVDSVGPLKLFEACRILRMNDVAVYQACTSEMFGDSPGPQNELTPMRPRSPYAVAKLAAYWTARNYREAYGLPISCGILFNHSSKLRGENFVCRKITRHVASVADGCTDVLYLGNLNAKRDWGHARDYVRGMQMMMGKSDDYVLATGTATTVRQFCEIAYDRIGIEIKWSESSGFCAKSGKQLICVDTAYYRPLEVEHLCGDATKARTELGWHPTYTLKQMIGEMIDADRGRHSVRQAA